MTAVLACDAVTRGYGQVIGVHGVSCEIQPGVTGLLLGRRIRGVFIGSVVTGALGTILGFLASVAFDLPSGASVILAMGGLALVAWIFDAVRRHREAAS